MGVLSVVIKKRNSNLFICCFGAVSLSTQNSELKLSVIYIYIKFKQKDKYNRKKDYK